MVHTSKNLDKLEKGKTKACMDYQRRIWAKSVNLYLHLFMEKSARVCFSFKKMSAKCLLFKHVVIENQGKCTSIRQKSGNFRM